MLKIGLLGYGKMGKEIDRLAETQGIDIVWRISSKNLEDRNIETIKEADVVIEFTRPEAAFDNVKACLEAGVPVISGTTGWAEELEKAKEICQSNGGALLWASNFSIGVNLFFALNRYLSSMMGNRPEYAASLSETHHIHKLDAPSGTAISLVQDLIAHISRLNSYKLVETGGNETVPDDTVPVTAHRLNEVPGTHQINWQSSVDEITIEHRAKSREGFAMGAITAAKWIAGKRGVFDIGDVLQIK